MADYRCPNCAGYNQHDPKCPTGGYGAVARNSLYSSISKALEEYWIARRLSGKQVTLSDLQDVVDKTWQESLK